MPGLRMPTPKPLVISKRPKLSLRDELAILRKWSNVDWACGGFHLTMRDEVEMRRANVTCAGCGRRAKRSEYQYDHERPRALGGSDEAENMRPFCVTMWTPAGMVHVGCHNLKTARDAAVIAKAKAQAGETGNGIKRKIPQRKNPWPKKGTRKLRSRPMRRGR